MSLFPNPVNEKAARAVAGGVVVLTIAVMGSTIAFGHGWVWLTVPLAYGFLARVVAGPRFSPLGQLATRVLAPRLGTPRIVAGPPKRFAQLVGAVLSVLAVVLGPVLHLDVAALATVGLITVAATLESVFGICLGCWMFGHLMRLGVIPEDTCEACNDVSARLAFASGGSGTLAG